MSPVRLLEGKWVGEAFGEPGKGVEGFVNEYTLDSVSADGKSGDRRIRKLRELNLVPDLEFYSSLVSPGM